VPTTHGNFLKLTLSGQYNDQALTHANWLQSAIGIPNLTSDVLLILDCYIESVSEEEQISYLYDDTHAWARYGIIFARYAQGSDRPGKLSEYLISILEDLAYSGRLEPDHELVNCDLVVRRLMETLGAVEDYVPPVFMGNDCKGSIVLAPILA
jgi:hypothetical protein